MRSECEGEYEGECKEVSVMGSEESKEKLLAGKGREKRQREERKVEECVLLSLQSSYIT